MEHPSQSENEEYFRKLQTLFENLKAKHITKPINSQITFVEVIRRGNELKQQELEKERTRLWESVASLEKELEEKEKLLQKETMVVSQQEKLVNEKIQEMKVRDQCKKQYNQRLANASGKVSAKDHELLAILKQKLRAYKMFTGIVWDYPNCNDKKISGYIRDEGDKQLKMFHMDLQGKSEEEIVSEMWKISAQKSGLRADSYRL